MSHTTTVGGLAIKLPSSIIGAVEALKAKGVDVQLLENTVPKMYYPDQEAKVGKCDYVIKIAGSKYDLGLKINDQQEYDLIFDEWNGDIRKQIGTLTNDATWDQNEKRLAHISQFTAEYNKHLISSQFEEKGIFDIDTTALDNGGFCMVANLENAGF